MTTIATVPANEENVFPLQHQLIPAAVSAKSNSFSKQCEGLCSSYETNV